MNAWSIQGRAGRAVKVGSAHTGFVLVAVSISGKGLELE